MRVVHLSMRDSDSSIAIAYGFLAITVQAHSFYFVPCSERKIRIVATFTIQRWCETESNEVLPLELTMNRLWLSQLKILLTLEVSLMPMTKMIELQQDTRTLVERHISCACSSSYQIKFPNWNSITMLRWHSIWKFVLEGAVSLTRQNISQFAMRPPCSATRSLFECTSLLSHSYPFELECRLSTVKWSCKVSLWKSIGVGNSAD